MTPANYRHQHAMTTDYRALCAELESHLSALSWSTLNIASDDEAEHDLAHAIAELCSRARAALAQPEPPADGEVAEMVAVLRADAECITAGRPELMQVTDNQLNRVADLLDCLSQSRLSGSSEEKREALKERLWHRYRTPSHRGGVFIPDRDFDSVFNEACALAQPEPVGPTDEEIEAACPFDSFHEPAEHHGWWSAIEWAEQHWSHPTQQPIPVSERLPGAEDCAPWPEEPDCDPWCWLGQEDEGGWHWAQASAMGKDADELEWSLAGGGWTHWLPFHALPLPATPENADG